MKLKSLYIVFFAILVAFSAVSCDDNLDSIGQTIQPGTDDITFEIDSVAITAKTVSLHDYIHVDNEEVILGEINDPVFGNLKADFLAEFYCGGGDDVQFKLGEDGEATVDSVRLLFAFSDSQFIGDKKKTMTVSIYEVTKDLETNFQTNIDPTKYCDMKTVLGQRFFSIDGLNTATSSDGTVFRDLDIELDKDYGVRLYNEWKKNKKVLSSSEELRKFTKGIYVTSDFGDKGMLTFPNINSYITAFVYYSYKLKKVHEPDVDSTVVSYIPLPMGYEVNKLTRVKNSSWSDIQDIPGNLDFSERTLVKAPAGVVTEITIPLDKIKEKGKKRIGYDDFSISSAIFKLTGFTEEESKLSITKRPDYLLFINKDSIDNFFKDKKEADTRTSIVMARNSNNNTYYFSNQGSISSDYVTNNLSTTINHYLSLEGEDEKKELKFLVIPIAATFSSYQVSSVANLLSPAAAIFRSKKEFMTMSLAFSRHNNIE